MQRSHKAAKLAAMSGIEERIRDAAMAWLDARPLVHVDYQFASQFTFEGERIALMDRGRGIRKPAGLSAAISIQTAFQRPGGDRPYDDAIGPDGLQRYKYEGTDPDFWTNVALRRALQLELPVIWFFGVADSRYEPIYPVWIVGEERQEHQFVLAVDPSQRFLAPGMSLDERSRRYVERTTKQRLHQRVFRSQVLEAYASRCTVCNLAHVALLDAAHIVPDGQPNGEPVVPNGMAMCKIHHAAFDSKILGIRPDLTLHIRQDILDEVDGPMLRHGLQEMHGQPLMHLPARSWARPDPARIEQRYEEFLAG